MAKTSARKKRTTRKKRTARSSAGGGEQRLYTLTEIGKMAGVSMPTMQRYKKDYQGRIPSQGEGRKQRYPEEAVKVVRQIKNENIAGRVARSRKARTKPDTGRDGYLPLTEIARRAGISYPTARKYAADHQDKLDSRGSGRARRYAPATIGTFKAMRKQSRRGPKAATARRRTAATPRPRATMPAKRAQAPSARSVVIRKADANVQALADNVRALERAQADISRQLGEILETLRRPVQVTIEGG